MTPERWATVERLYHEALARDANQRGAFLSEACAGDDLLRRDVESLIAHDGEAGFLSTPMAVVDAGKTLIGHRLGPYVISSRIGEGGMGEVYRARDDQLGRQVAIKVLPRVFTSDPERLARFEREARVLAALNHPHIGAIYGLERVDGVPALVLELVEGPTLAERIAKGPMPLSDALSIAAQIAEALEAAHEKGIIHRDLKPANIKITPAGVVKVLDFGLAKLGAGGAGKAGGAGRAGQAGGVTEAPAMTIGGTREGVILGTAAYMSPEQARGQVVDERTDIWAFASVLYEMLTGRLAFSGSTVSDTIVAILEREPEWRALPDATPAVIRHVLQRCLRKDPRQRLRHVGDARLEIEDAIALPKTMLDWTVDRQPNTAPQYSRGKQMIAAAGVVIVVAVGAWGVTRFRQQDTSGPVLRLQINPPEGGRIGVLGSGRGPSLALSPDGRMAVCGATVNGKYALWLRSLDDTMAHLLSGTEEAQWPFWSPDGQSIAFFARGKLQRIDVAGGAAFTVSDVPRAFGGAWGSDGRILVGLFGGALAAVSASGGDLSPLTTLDTSMADHAHNWPQVLPGGHFLYWAGSSRPENDGVIYAASFEKPNERVSLVRSDTGALYSPGPDGRGYLLWRRGRTLLGQEFDGATLKFSGEPRPLADAVGVNVAIGLMAVAVSTGGTLLFASADGHQLTWFDRAGKQLGTLGDPGQYNSLRFSPNGKQIAAARTDAGRELWLIDLDRGTSRLTTFDSRGGKDPQWSPDGRTILFQGDFETTLYRKDATGATPDQRVAPWHTVGYNLTDWSRNGRFVLVTRRTVETQDDIWIVPVTPDGHLAADAQPTPYLRTPVNELQGRFSPELNPRWIAYQSNENGRDEIYVQSFPEPRGPHRISTHGGSGPRWGSGGRELFYQSLDGKVMVVDVQVGADSLEASAPRELFALPPRSIFEVAPDGQRLLVRLPDPTPHPLTMIVNWPALLKQKATGQ